MTQIESIEEKRQRILDSGGHLLVEGGPGSGKTTIALLKADKIASSGALRNFQRLLFLSFARATVSRVEEQSRSIISQENKQYLEINTYHGFCWQLIQSFGYLIAPHRLLKLITPPSLAAKIAGLSEERIKQLKRSLLMEEGIIGFDLFAEMASSIIEQSTKIVKIISAAYPFIIVDEFQDTDIFEWKLIRLMGQHSTIIALADLEQRIYEFRGASVTRIPDFVSEFTPLRVDLGKENRRSPGTDIVQFGDDLLTGTNIGKKYKQVQIIPYRYYKGDTGKISINSALSASIRRLRSAKPDGKWSIAVLVRRKLDTLNISTYLTSKKIEHDVIIDPEGPALAAVVISSLLQPITTIEEDARILLIQVIEHIKGRKGVNTTKADMVFVNALETYLLTKKIKGKNRIELLTEINRITDLRRSLLFIGVPEIDWLAVRDLFRQSTSEALFNIFDDGKFVKLLHKGALLSSRLSEMWRDTGNYHSAAQAVREALTQEHFSMASKVYQGIYVMNIHKSKGKEFDEVIIWEEAHHPIVYPKSIDQGRLLLRVGVTRARTYTTFLTPSWSPCILLSGTR